ncbi:HypC/HybG/HupF family hydrogenase formation chaperone [Synechococcus elongatus]|uniref:Hydrogenase maturation protein HypC n=1 Tax=Synechococcus sp. (strain ATCC 27144 / PCC 6301 / SAUG 1402/1) TaxID=269084 RepID=A0A0H3KA19_SYNP6|nr:HypC/HybG/HupF family hydrogenase formation chaperone [Synechococcus elongatus]AJD56967.1 hydrogenase assembly protein HupF [Synechococcus elongatus UTEX 2973]MBD2587300.1 HypC/HybG/HupF family hydrogenase formation chaperone [Synechococcus elongatus FACHB-242]MBD2688369.1 HypC/HybG/HupF family hydrogenase formation chaperone [Synechococcus elongatus FACHB-1061]MBD2705919.1 HypC/HybG/HupF family hydrogenase formation chaperone [Synechococcus elongatus PCC 7942 = FACHB-805]UOW72378.1 Hydroge
MCLAVPGQLLSIHTQPDDPDGLFRSGRVSFGGAIRAVSLACVPEARVGDYVIVHAGLALTVLDAEEAERTLVITAAIAAEN